MITNFARGKEFAQGTQCSTMAQVSIRMNEWCFRPQFCSVMLYWARANLSNEMNFVMNHARSGVSIRHVFYCVIVIITVIIIIVIIIIIIIGILLLLLLSLLLLLLLYYYCYYCYYYHYYYIIVGITIILLLVLLLYYCYSRHHCY